MADRRRLREKTVQLPQFDRVAMVRAQSFDADANTVEIVWTTGASVRRYDWWDGTEYDEVLSVDPESVRLERLNLGAPFLDTHCSYGCDNVIGSIVPDTASIEKGRGVARIQLSKAAGVADTVQKIREGVIRNVSVGYWIHKVEKTEADDGTVARWNVVDWEPLEISAVPIPADAGSQIRSDQSEQDGRGPALRSCVVISNRKSNSAPKGGKEATMATRTAALKNAKEAAKRLADLEAENKRLRADLAKREGKEEGADDERDGDDEEGKDKDSDDERDGDETESKDDGSDDERVGDETDEEHDAEEGDEGRSGSAGKSKRALTEAEVRKAAEHAVRSDRKRGAAIREIGTQFGFPKLAERHAAGETTVRAFKDLVLDKLAERQKKRGDTTFGAAGTPEIGDETRVANVGPTAQSRAYDKGAAAAKALLGK